ncbi:glutaminase [Dokdonella sp. MW10]|uniref:glutaminase n=1 Tax=Dokdonella sp. MW10 TaxID=2992926 RepID=UPI003F7FC7DB
MRTIPHNPYDLRRHDLPAILATIDAEVRERFGEGTLPEDIPSLVGQPRERFGMAVVTLDGDVHAVGDARVPLAIQSVSKVHTLTMALHEAGDALWRRVGREPSGDPFNSLVQLEYEHGIPRNPFINAGALVVDDVLMSLHADPENALLAFLRARTGNPRIGVDPPVTAEERRSGPRNIAVANFLRSFDNLACDVDAVLDFYSFHCALRMDCVDLARSVLYLANAGECPVSGERVTSAEGATRINAVMLTCGTYDAAGDFAFHVGLPAKSGVGGAIVAVVPKVMALCAWSPALDAKGNSMLGGYALHRFTRMTGLSVF